MTGLGLFGSLNMATRSLSTARAGTEIAGNNLANVNTPGYARQRVSIVTSNTVPSSLGPQGTGSMAVGISSLRDILVDSQLLGEFSIRGSLDSQQQSLQYIQSASGQQIDRQAQGATGAGSIDASGAQNGIAEDLANLFSSFQSVSNSKTTDLAERQVLMLKAQNLSTQFNQVGQRLDGVRTAIGNAITVDVTSANRLVDDIASLNAEIVKTEVGGNGRANDLRDIRQQRLEDLSKIANFTVSETPQGASNISIDGVPMITGAVVNNRLEAFDAGGGQILVRAQGTATTLNFQGGSIHGRIEARDGALVKMRGEIEALASNLITEVNGIHASGFGLTGATGNDFFLGTGAGDIRINPALKNDPRLIQASASAGAVGNNSVILRLAQLGDKPITSLLGQTFGGYYAQSIASMGQELNTLNTQIGNQDVVQNMLERQRDSVMGVSIDEEMTDLMKFQKAFSASAKMITTIDEMLDTIVNLKR